MTTETAQELVHLADWIQRRYGLSGMSKIRQACQAEVIHTEIVRRLGEANVTIQPSLKPPRVVVCTEQKPCCDRRDQYNGYASGRLLFTCPKHCACHD
jgi:hypothetical protein